jgi:hypothetical protein
MKITIKSMAVIVVAAFVLGIGGAASLGLWHTTSTKQPATLKEGEFAGMPNPADIRGSYTWADIAKAFNFDVKLALQAFGAANETEKVNTLEAIYGSVDLPAGTEIGTDSVRLFVSLLTGLPHTAEESTVLPISAIAILRENGKADASLIDAAAARAYDPAGSKKPAPAAATTTTTAPAQAAPAVSPTTASTVPAAKPASSTATTVKGESTTSSEHVATPGTVGGKTTFKDLKDWGLSEEKIKSVTSGKIGSDDLAVKDWAAANGLTFSELKVKLQDLLTKK